MGFTLQIASAWRVLRDVNLEEIRASAQARFSLLVVADVPDDARGLVALLSPTPEPHPWVVCLRAGDPLPTLPERPLLAMVLSRVGALSPALVAARDALASDGIGVVAVAVGDPRTAVTPAITELRRVGGPAIDSRLARDVARALVMAAPPEWRTALARQLPPLRQLVVDALIEETSQANASFALASGMAEIVPLLTVPMNVGDMLVLSKNQLTMSYRIALACGLDGDPRRLVPEIIGVIGGGLVLRQLARQLVGFLPIIGLLPKVAVAYGGTFAIGRAVAAWALEGREASAETMQRVSREGLERGRELARALAARTRRRRQRVPRQREPVAIEQGAEPS